MLSEQRWVDLEHWSAYREPFHGIEIERPNERTPGLLRDLVYLVKQEVRDILRQEISSDHVVLALTESSLLLQRQKRKGRSGKVLIDPMEFYAGCIAR
jgi:hypothetical protein